MRIATALLAALGAVAGCTGMEDELAGEDGDGVDDGKADDTGAFTYYQVTASGAAWKVARVNRANTECGDRVERAECAVDQIDYERAGLTADEASGAIAGADVIVRGTLTGTTLAATELWVGNGRGADGVYVKIRDANVDCTTLVCESRDEIKLNSVLRANASALDFGPVGATETEAADAQAAIGQDGLIIVGNRYTERGARARTVEGYYRRVAPAKRWNVHDVSILFPLPEAGDEDLLIPVNGSGHTLLPEAAFRLLGDPATGIPFLVEGPGRDALYPDLRVTAVRVDPCFDEASPTPATRCVRQVRLAVQPVIGGSAYDASLHLFFTLDDAAFVRLLVQLRAVGLGGAGPASLAVHPTMAREGLRGPTAVAIKAALLEACQLTRLTKFTVMVTGRSKNWFFFTLEPGPDGAFARVRGDTHESAFTDQGLPALRDPVPLGDPAFPDEMLATASVTGLSDAQLLAGIDKLERLANPRLARTSETQCASCHATGTTLDYALASKELSLVPRTPGAFSPVPFIAPSLGHGFSNHHAFSYLGVQPTVSRRVANDSILTTRFLSSTTFLGSLSADLRAQLE